MKPTIRDIRESARGRWIEILQDLAPALGRYSSLPGSFGKDRKALERVGRHVPCPVHGGKNGDGFRLFRNVAETGGGICNTCGPKPNGFELLQWLNGWTFRETVEAVAAKLGMEVGKTRLPLPQRARAGAAAPRRTDEKLRRSLRQIWQECLLVSDRRAKTARRYLQRRGLSVRQLRHANTVRFHPRLVYLDEDGKAVGEFPAIVCLVTDATGRPVTLYRIYLSDEGAKAPVGAPKKMMPVPESRKVTGGCVQLGPACRVLGIAEGIETALAVNRATGMTVWAALSATLLERWEPPAEAETIYIWADSDRPDRQGIRRGEEAAERLRQRLAGTRIKARVLLPSMPIPGGKKGVDWNDVLLDQGSYGFPHPRLLGRAA